MTARIARCHCGACAIDCIGAPRKVSLCHCLDCQRRTGSAFGLAAFYERSNVTPRSGTPHRFERSSASGCAVRFHFCPACGSTLWWEPTRLPDLVAVAIGAFADPAFPAPTQSVWTGDKHDWLAVPDGLAVRSERTPR